MISSATNAVRDPRCPHCGRPVIGPFVQGFEGRYHPQCTEPPQEWNRPSPWPVLPSPNDPIMPFPPYLGPTITWNNLG